MLHTNVGHSKFGYTVVPAFSDPSDQRSPAMYGHFSNVPIVFQRICPLNQRTPAQRGRGQRFFIIIPLLGRTVIFIFDFFSLKNILKMALAISCTAPCMLGAVVFLSNARSRTAQPVIQTHNSFTFDRSRHVLVVNRNYEVFCKVRL